MLLRQARSSAVCTHTGACQQPLPMLHRVAQHSSRLPRLRVRTCTAATAGRDANTSSSSQHSDVDDKVAMDAQDTRPGGRRQKLPDRVEVIIKEWSPSLGELDNKVKRGELNLRPKYQRGLVWSKEMSSRVVVTVAENRMIPTIYIEEDEKGIYHMMDGKQRVASLLAFMNANPYIGAEDPTSKEALWKNAPVKLKITDEMTVSTEWNGIRFVDLPEDRQLQFTNYTLNAVVIRNTTDRDVLLNTYEDINSGSVAHTAQQSRRAVYHGRYIDLLEELAYNREFMLIQDRILTDVTKESDRELALRFFAMQRNSKNFKAPMFSFLNKEIRQHREMSETEAKKMKKMFTQTTETVWVIWNTMSCKDENEKFSPYLWDATMVAVCEELFPGGPASSHTQRKSELYMRADAIKQAYEKLLVNSEFKETLASTSSAKVTKRIKMMQELLREAAPKTMELDKKRTFTRKEKKKFWEESTAAAPGGEVVCGECGSIIPEFGDAQLDHIEPHSQGGRTVLKNAQWLHTHCNKMKGNRPAQQQAGAPVDFAVSAADASAAVRGRRRRR